MNAVKNELTRRIRELEDNFMGHRREAAQMARKETLEESAHRIKELEDHVRRLESSLKASEDAFVAARRRAELRVADAIEKLDGIVYSVNGVASYIRKMKGGDSTDSETSSVSRGSSQTGVSVTQAAPVKDDGVRPGIPRADVERWYYNFPDTPILPDIILFLRDYGVLLDDQPKEDSGRPDAEEVFESLKASLSEPPRKDAQPYRGCPHTESLASGWCPDCEQNVAISDEHQQKVRDSLIGMDGTQQTDSYDIAHPLSPFTGHRGDQHQPLPELPDMLVQRNQIGTNLWEGWIHDTVLSLANTERQRRAEEGRQ